MTTRTAYEQLQALIARGAGDCAEADKLRVHLAVL
jgi:hypothetical protein